MNTINITATETTLSAFYVQHILDHTSCQTVYIQLINRKIFCKSAPEVQTGFPT